MHPDCWQMDHRVDRLAVTSGSPPGKTEESRSPGGFSLLEVIIVVVIIGIIAAIAIPRISSSTERTREASLLGNLAVMRRAIDAYAAEHNQVNPGINGDGLGGAALSGEAFVRQLTMYTALDGRASTTGDQEYRLGPYLRHVPELPVGDNQGSATVAVDTGNSPPLVKTGTDGWVYNPNTGEIIANTDDANMEGTRAYDEY
jgi:prepilin-type N-terminal cleavage/methylation domain-containing protein